MEAPWKPQLKGDQDTSNFDDVPMFGDDEDTGDDGLEDDCAGWDDDF